VATGCHGVRHDGRRLLWLLVAMGFGMTEGLLPSCSHKLLVAMGFGMRLARHEARHEARLARHEAYGMTEGGGGMRHRA
jgi:hypothetical protein